MKKRVKPQDIGKPSEKLTSLDKEDFKPLTAPFLVCTTSAIAIGRLPSKSGGLYHEDPGRRRA